MTCEACGGRGFELVGVEPAGVVALRCGRCGRVQRVVADPRPPAGGPQRPSRYLAALAPEAALPPGQLDDRLDERLGAQVPAAAPPR